MEDHVNEGKGLPKPKAGDNYIHCGHLSTLTNDISTMAWRIKSQTFVKANGVEVVAKLYITCKDCYDKAKGLEAYMKEKGVGILPDWWTLD